MGVYISCFTEAYKDIDAAKDEIDRLKAERAATKWWQWLARRAINRKMRPALWRLGEAEESLRDLWR